MIEKLKTVNKKYSILYGKKRDEKEDINKKQMQIEKIKNIFKDNDSNEKNNDENEKLNEQIYKVNFNSNNIESFNNFSLIKNSIGSEKLETIFQNLKEKYPSNKKNNKLKINKESNKSIKNNINNIQNKENVIENNTKDINSNKDNIMIKNESNNNNNNKLNEDLFNVTQDQMKIFDNEVDKLYNNHKKNIKLKIFQINHPYLHNIKLINNNIEKTTSSMTKEQRLLPLLQKQKLILKKIQENNISRSNSSLSKVNNDLKDYSISNIDNQSDRLISKNNFNKKNNLEIFHNNIQKTLDNNNILDNLTTSDNCKNNSNEKNNLKLHRNINFKPFTLQQYKNKYENNNNLRISLGGLGPNIGSDDWNKRHKILERKKLYSNYIENDSEFNFFKKKGLKNRKSEDSKTVASKKDSYSYESNNGVKYKILKTENNIINNKIKLPLINQRFKNSNKVKTKRNNNLSNDVYKVNQDHDIEGSETDLKQLIKQYEEYNENFKL